MTFFEKLDVEANRLGNSHDSTHIESATVFRRAQFFNWKIAYFDA